jgi:tRNA-(ms[2]io[6]A)-hydroxylase
VLHLKYRTPSAWAQAALADVRALLVDHAFCEDKAAASARMLMKQHEKLRGPMAALAKEEDGHAQMCRKFLKERGAAAGIKYRNPYVSALRRQGLGLGSGELLDKLLVASLIEARSCERFQLLADATRGGTLGRFYEDLLAAEARHHVLFVDLASDLFGSRPAHKRLGELSALEAEIVRSLPWAPRIH